jgi:hypothetical protein
MNVRGVSYWAKRTAGVKLWPRRKVVGIASYHPRYSVYVSRRVLLVTFAPGVYNVYIDLCTISASSQNVL